MPCQTESEWMESRGPGKQDMRPELQWPKTHPRMGHCPQCDARAGISRPPFPVLRRAVFAALTFMPYFFIGITLFWFLVGFAIWRKGKATCNACAGQGIWFKAGRDTKGLVWDAAIILLVILWGVGLPFLLYDLANPSQSGTLG